MKSLKSSGKRSPKTIIKSNISVTKHNMERFKNFSSSNKMKNISSLIGSIQKVRLDDPQLSNRSKNIRQTGKLTTTSAELHRQKSKEDYNSTTSQDQR